MPDAAPQRPDTPVQSPVPFRPQPRSPQPLADVAPDAPEVVEQAPSATRSRSRKVVCFALGVVGVLGLGGLYWATCVRTNPQQQLQSALALYENGDKEQAFPLLQKAAQEGAAAAFVPLADCYEQGVGVAADVAQARQWYDAAVRVGVQGATVSMAELCYKDADYEQALRHYEAGATSLTAEQLCRAAHAANSLAAAASAPELAAPYYQKAVDFLTSATQKGSSAAAVELGNMYYWGQGVEASRESAAEYYAQAADCGDARACCRAAWCLLELATPAQDARALHYLQQAAEQGDAQACYYLALCILNARGTARDEALAVSWLRKAADLQHPEALRKLAFVYRDSTPAQLPAAIACLEKAALLGDAEAQFNLAWCLWHGFGVQPAAHAALYWCERAAAQQFPPALEFLAKNKAVVLPASPATAPQPAPLPPAEPEQSMPQLPPPAAQPTAPSTEESGAPTAAAW